MAAIAARERAQHPDGERKSGLMGLHERIAKRAKGGR